MKGFRIGIPEQQLKPHAKRARGTVADIYIYIYLRGHFGSSLVLVVWPRE